MEQDINTQPTPSEAPITTPKPITPGTTTVFQITRGVVIGMIVFSTILVAALYMGSINLPAQNSLQAIEPPQGQSASATADQAISAMQTQGTSDEITSIEADVNATDFSSLDDINSL